jgi:hypothetical protein
MIPVNYQVMMERKRQVSLPKTPAQIRREELIEKARVEIPDVTVSVIDTYIKNRDETAPGARNLYTLSGELMSELKKAYPDVDLSMIGHDNNNYREIPQYADYDSFRPDVIFNAKQAEKKFIEAKRWKWVSEREQEEFKRREERAGPLINLNAKSMKSGTNTKNAAITKRMNNFKNLTFGGYRKSSHKRRYSKYRLTTKKQRR